MSSYLTTSNRIHTCTHAQAAAPSHGYSCFCGFTDKNDPESNHYATVLWAASQAGGHVSYHAISYLRQIWERKDKGMGQMHENLISFHLPSSSTQQTLCN